MNSNGILTTRAEVEQKEGYAYFYPDHEEIADVKLDFRAWGPKTSLCCYFSYLEDHTGLLLYAWGRRIGINNEYRPQKCDIDFSQVKDGTYWRVNIKRNTKGNLTWYDAVLLKY